MSTPDRFTVPAGSVVITPTELYREMQATHTLVSEMRGDLREIARAIPDHEVRLRTVEPLARQAVDDVADHEVRLVDHEDRLRSVERKIWIAVAVAATGGGGLGAFLTNLFGGGP